MANSVDLDETAHYEQSHLDVLCSQRYQYWSVGMKGLMSTLRKTITWAPFLSIVLVSLQAREAAKEREESDDEEEEEEENMDDMSSDPGIIISR